MSFGTQLAAATSKVTSAVGGAPMLVAVAAAGLLVGGIVGGFAGGQPQTPGQSAQVLDIYPCWKGGTAFAQAARGQKVWLTGKNADSTFYRIHSGSPTHPEGWVYAPLITVQDPSSLPVVDCGAITALMIAGAPLESQTVVQNNSPSPEPTPTPSPTPTREPRTPEPDETAENTPEPTQGSAATQKPPSQATPKPTKKPTPKPTPTDPPDTTPPNISALGASPTTIFDRFNCNPSSSTVTASVSDSDSGIDSVTLFYREVGGNLRSKGMTHQGSGRYSASISAPEEGFHSNITFSVVATDNAGNDAEARGPQTIVVTACIT